MAVAMRILHSAALLSPPAGVLNQMEWEQLAASKMGLQWDARLYCPQAETKGSPIAVPAESIPEAKFNSRWKKSIAWFRLRAEYHNWLLSLEHSYDAFVLRYYVHDPFQLRFIVKCKKPVYLVHHTLEVPELKAAGNANGYVRAMLESVIGSRAIRSASGIIGVTREIIHYEATRSGQLDRPALLYSNGVAYSSGPVADHRTTVPELLFVASTFAAWHGLDLLLAEMARSKLEFVLHLVGEIHRQDKLNALSDARIVVHGSCSSHRIRGIASRCAAGLSSFALQRKGMNEACTLKVREYLMMGLPVYAGHQDVFPTEFPYFRNGGLDLERMLHFADGHMATAREVVAETAKPYIDKKALLRKLYLELQALDPASLKND